MEHVSAYETPHLPGLPPAGPTASPAVFPTGSPGASPGASPGGSAHPPSAGGLPALQDLDWVALAAELDEEGVALTPPLLTREECAEVRALFDEPALFRSTVTMARHRFGEGRYRYFTHPLPDLVRTLRQRLYPPLAHIATTWAERLGEAGFPHDHEGLVAACAAAGQHRPTPLLLRYGPGGYNCLHQDVYGELTFPLQVAVMLDRPDEDFTGGESVFVEQRPRAQSRPVVKRPRQGQGMVFAVRHRPVRSIRGWSRVTLRHGVSAVHSGQRHVLGVIFHDAR
ncbi:prolyl 4-hydroxylase [Streptomyces roseolilacinus]|uniref:Prolyl 4-hydroxylase n=1 Tax=Streptomyces roseolilacinus TaxID=66904 RepID=A0A918ELK8_9ACTN|nr:prolyl 4-hydroxylase [Streptomyces roseolilacinus]